MKLQSTHIITLSLSARVKNSSLQIVHVNAAILEVYHLHLPGELGVRQFASGSTVRDIDDADLSKQDQCQNVCNWFVLLLNAVDRFVW